MLKPVDNVDKPEENIKIRLSSPISLDFSLKYLVNFTKAAPLSAMVTLYLGKELPLLVSFKMEGGHLRFYLAPKLDVRPLLGIYFTN